MKNTFKKLIEETGYNYKKVLTWMVSTSLLAFLGGIIITIITKNIIPLLIALVLSIGIIFAFFYYFLSLRKQLYQAKENELFYVLGYFEIYIENQRNVYQSFQEIKQFCSPSLAEDIDSLLKEIDQDKTITPFITFAAKFKNTIVQSLMISIFQMVDSGENANQINEFTILFDNVKKEQNLTLLMNKKKSFESMHTFPLLGAGLISLLLTYSLLVVIGG